MQANPKALMAAFPVLRNREERSAFLDAVQSYAADLGYEAAREEGWLILGDAGRAGMLMTADDSPSGRLVLLEVLKALPENRRDGVAFFLLEDPKFGCYAFCRSHPEVKTKLVLRLENLAGGDKLRYFPTKRLNADRRKLTSLYRACGYFGKKSLLVQEKHLLPWYVPFPYEVRLCVMGSGKKEAYGKRLKTSAQPDETNVNILRAALVSYICCDAAQ